MHPARGIVSQSCRIRFEPRMSSTLPGKYIESLADG